MGLNLKKQSLQNIDVLNNAHSVPSKSGVDLGLHAREMAKLFGHIVPQQGVCLAVWSSVGLVEVDSDVRVQKRVKLQGHYSLT